MNRIFPWLVALVALALSACAAYYSVSGLAKLFAGSALAVILMASSLEAAKLVIASLLYQQWKTINRALKSYLMIALAVLMLITSVGIYGFLSQAYQETSSKLLVAQNQQSYLKERIEVYQSEVEVYDREIEAINSNIATLSERGADQIQVRDTTSSTGVRTTISTRGLRAAQERIAVEESNKREAMSKRQVLRDSVQNLRLQVLEIQNADFSGELGPLIYLSKITGFSMDRIINILLLVVVFVFDPLAISLVVGANHAFKMAGKKPEEIVLPTKEKERDVLDIEVEAQEVKSTTPPPTDVPDVAPDIEKMIRTHPDWSTYRKNRLIDKLPKDDDTTKTY